MAFEILEIIVDGKKIKSPDISIKWKDWRNGEVYTGSIERYANDYAALEAGIAVTGGRSVN